MFALHLQHGYAGPAPTARLSGTTAIAGTPDIAISRVVHLFQGVGVRGMIGHNAAPVKWMQSDADGNWEFRNLDPALRYHVIAYDHTGAHDPVIKMNLVPTVG